MGVAAGGGEALVAERLLYEVGRGAPVEGVGGVGVAEPVRGDVLFDAGVTRCFADDPLRLRGASVFCNRKELTLHSETLARCLHLRASST